MPEIHRVCVVGAGSAGLTALKSLQEYGSFLKHICDGFEGIDAVAFEKSSGIAGIWRYKEGKCDGVGNVMRSTILNTSKEFISFSDFPTKKEDANFMRNTEVYRFLSSYVEHFKLKEKIRFNTAVIEIKRTSDYDTTGRWEVTYKLSDKVDSEVFDAVMICTGHHVYPFMPAVPGLATFKGRVLHSHDYQTPAEFENRRVLVVGLGNSGGDVLCELGRQAKQVYGSSRYGTWVTQRVHAKLVSLGLKHICDGLRGIPRDIVLRTRFLEWHQSLLPAWYRRYLAIKSMDERLDHRLHGLRPKEAPGQSPVLLADDLPLHLARRSNKSCSGWVQLRVGVSHFTENHAHYEDGTSDEIDDVIFCTGYSFDFDFVEKGRVIPVDDNQTRLYKRIFPPDLKYSTLAVIGLVDPLGPTITVCEMQSRAVAHIWARKIPLPSEAQMQSEISRDKAATAARYRCSARRASLQVDYIPYMDDMARIIGAIPDLSLEFFFKDPLLALQLHLGPVSSHQYRLRGPNPWEGARRQLLGTHDRVYYGMNTRLRSREEANFDEDNPRVLQHLLPTAIPFFRHVVFVLFIIFLVLKLLHWSLF